MGHRFHRRTTLRLVEKVLSPAHHLNSSMECRGAGYGLCVDRRGVDAAVVPHIANAWKTLACTVSELIDGCITEGQGIFNT